MTNFHTNPSIQPAIHKQFKKSFRWTLAGSITYEVLKTAHIFILLKILPSPLFGIMGSIFASIYMTAYIADLGAYNSLPPFISMAIQNKFAFRRFVFRYTLIPHMPIVLVCAIAATFFMASKFHLDSTMLMIVSAIIVLETTRCFLRLLLHATFHSRRTVLVDLCAFALFLGTTWIPYLYFGYPLELKNLFIPHLIDSLFATILYIIFLVHFQRKLPITDSSNLPANTAKRLITSRLFNYLLRVSRSLFSTNFLTPLFAVKYGLTSAGLFYFASTFATGLQSIVKSTINYSGNALLASLKDNTQQAKKDAFHMLWGRLTTLLAPVIIFLIVNYQPIVKLSKSTNTSMYTLSLLLLFILLPAMEFFSILYEQFYIIEEAASKLFFFKLFELTLFYLLISSTVVTSPIATLLGLIVIRLIGITIIALSAYYTWRIRLNIKTKLTYILINIALALILRFILG